MEIGNNGSSTIGSMMSLGRIGEAKPIPRTPTVFESENDRTSKLIAQGVIADEKFAENSLRAKLPSTNIEATAKLAATMDNFIDESKNTASRLDDRLPPDKLEKMGFGKNRDWAEPLSQTASGLLDQMKMISEALWQDGRYQDNTIRGRLKDQITDSSLSTSEKEELKRVADGFHHIRNMSLNYVAAKGDTEVWVRPESKGGKVSDSEDDRISLVHLHDQIKIYPQLATLLEELDDAVVKNASIKDFEIGKFFESIAFGKDLGLDGEPLWKREYLCDLAFNWYRIAGFPDLRKFSNRTKQYKNLMPSGFASDQKVSPEDPKYLAAIKAPNCDIGFSPYFFLMDPLSLQADVLKQNKDVIAKARVGVNKSNKTEHSVINLGWRPVAWDFIDNALVFDAVGPENINDKSLKDLGFSQMSNEQWENFLYDDDAPGIDLLQKQNIKFAEKAMNTRKELMACMDVLGFSLDNVNKLFGAVNDLIRTEKNDTIFNREKIAPQIFQTILYTGLELGQAGVQLNIKKDDLDYFMKALRLKYKPIEMFTSNQWTLLKSYCKS